MCALYSPPTLHLGNLNSAINVADLESTSLNSTLTQAQGDARYLKLARGIEYGPVNFTGTESHSGTETH